MKKNEIGYIAATSVIAAATMILKDRVNEYAVMGILDTHDTKTKRIVSYIGTGVLTTAGALAIITAASAKLANVFKIERNG